MAADNPSPTQEVEIWTMYRCEEEHGLLRRSQTHLGFTEPPGGRLECNFCEPAKPPRFVRSVEVMPVEDHQRLLQAEVEKREEVEARLAKWEDEENQALGAAVERAEAAESKLSSLAEKFEKLSAERAAERDATKPTDHTRTRVRVGLDGESIAFRIAAQLLRDKGTEQAGRQEDVLETVEEVQCSYGCESRAPSDGQKVPTGWGRTGMVGEVRWACPDHLDEMRRDCGLSLEQPTDG